MESMVTTIDEQALKSLYDEKKFRTLFERGSAAFGSKHKWPTPELELLRGRTLNQLGHGRTYDAVVYRLWRKKDQRFAELTQYYISVLHFRRGPLVALRELDQVAEYVKPNSLEEAYLACERSTILSRYRDFSAAEACIQKLGKHREDKWVNMQLARIYHGQDNYAKAQELVTQVLEKDASYRPALQYQASLFQIRDDLDAAINILEPLWLGGESYWVGSQLFNFYIEQQEYTKAQDCLDRLQTLPPFQTKEVTSHLNAMRADLLCAQQQYESALEFLEQKSFYQQNIAQAIARSEDHSRRKVLDVPFVRQHHMTCAPASMVAVSQYWQVEADHEQVANAICYGGTQALDERRWAEGMDWYVREFDLDFESLKALIDLEIPVLLSTVEPGSAHLQIIVGYDETTGTYLLRDPHNPRLQEMLISGCQDYYASTGPRAMIMVPQDKAKHIKSLNLPQAALYDQLYVLNSAIDKHDRQAAVEAMQKAQALDAEHRLTIYCQRTIAFYDNDEQKLLATTEKLLEKYPKDTNLQLSKVSSLNSLGASTAVIEYLEELNKEEHAHFLIKSRLAEYLRYDHRHMERVEKIFNQLLACNPLHDATLYAYAGLLWDKGEYERSCQLYRFVTCLEDKNERYADSYFKAARFRKQTEQAAKFLVDRYKRFGKKSSGPIISLFYALDSLERTNEAFKYLNHALKLRPDDGDLLAFAALKYLQIQKTKNAITLATRAKKFVHPIRYYRICAEIYEAKLDKDKAIACLKKVLSFDPLNYSANNNILRLYVELDKQETADAFIEKQISLCPGNSSLLQLKIQWMDESEYEKAVQAHLQYTRHHPGDDWGFRGLAYAYRALGDYEKALEAAREAVAIGSRYSANLCCLADVYYSKQALREAREYYRQAIALSCDCTRAYIGLLNSTPNHQAQKEELAYIHEQLLSQVTYGDGILEYQKQAGKWLAHDEINQFLQLAIEERPDLWQSWLALASSLRENGENKAAIGILDRAIKRFPLLPRFYLERASSFRHLNKLEQAKRDLTKALEMSPGWSGAANELSDILEAEGAFEQAIELHKRTIKHAPFSSTSYGYLASLYWRGEKSDQAIATLEKALKINPHYYWAWRCLHEWQQQSDKQGQVIEQLALVREQFPASGALASIHAELVSSVEESANILKDFLGRYPHNESVCNDYISLLAQYGQFDEAFSFTTEEYWQGDCPIAIQAKRAWLHAENNEINKAIQLMEQVAKTSPNFYESWRLLARWYSATKDTEKLVSALDQCQRLYPNDADVLGFIAELLQRFELDENRVSALLKRAFELDPTDQYNGLSYIDDVLAKEDFDAAEKALDLLSLHCQNAFVYSREILLRLEQSERDKAIEQWQKILLENTDNVWVVDNSWKKLKQYRLSQRAVQCITDLREQNKEVSSYAGRCLFYYDLQQKGMKDLSAQLSKFDAKDCFDDRYLEGYLRQLINDGAKLPKNIEKTFQQRLQEDATNWGLVGYIKAEQEDWKGVVNWMRDGDAREDAEAWMLYFYSLAYRQLGDWTRGKKVMQQAFSLGDDGYRDDILIWFTLDRLLENEPVALDHLHYINVDDLAGLSRYPYSLIRALASMEQGNFVDDYDSISPCLRQCQRAFQESHESPAIKLTKKQAFNYLANTIEGSILKVLFWRWRLSNHF